MIFQRFLVTGATQRDDAISLGDGAHYNGAKLLRVDSTTKTVEVLISYDSAGPNYPEENPGIGFTAGTLDDNRLYLCTETEVFIYEYPGLELIHKVSYPFFQNIHHVTPVGDHIAVTSTGLDMVVLLNRQTLQPVAFKNVLGKDPWHRFSKDVDYRKVHSTKPHDSHPNFTFTIDDELWVTRFIQRDAVSLRDMNRRIDIGIQGVHDGSVVGDYVYFTCVNGNIVIANKHTLLVEEVIDLNVIEGIDLPLGWCRGLLIDGDIAYVGFTRVRKTRIKENVEWVKNFVRGSTIGLKTRIVGYNLTKRTKVGEIFIPVSFIDAIYSLLGESKCL